MIYVGMDVSSKSFVIHAINGRDKRVIWKGEVEASEKGLMGMLISVGMGKKQVIFESGNQTKWIFDYLKKQGGVNVHVVHPNEVKWISASSGKTDKVDARKLAELGRAGMLPRRVHMVEGETRKLRELLSARDQVQRKRIALMNTLRGYIKQEGKRISAKFFTQKEWEEIIEKIEISEGLRIIMKEMVTCSEALKESENRLTAEAVKIKDKRIELVESIPGIGKLGARVVVSGFDEAKRFDNKKRAANYAALAPTIYQSGNETHLGRINRDGRQEMRRAMLQSAHAVARTKNEEAKPLRDFFERIEKRRGKKRAIVALARKLITTAYGVLKSESLYEPNKLKQWA